MKLHLLRHAKTEPFSDSGKDFDRKLMKKGILQAENIAHYFKSKNFHPTHIYCSDAARTRQTIKIVKEGNEFTTVKYLDKLYLAESPQLLSFIWEEKHNEELLIIGHNNGLSDLASYFTGEFIDLSTCEYICISFEISSWEETSKGNGTITERYHPKINL
jgi:phosphohistidine phosphatase